MVDYSNIPPDSRRVPLENRIQLKFDRFSGFVSEYTANLSPSGVFIKTKEPKAPGTVLEFEFRLGDGFELIRGRGEVIWNRGVEEGPSRPAGMGVRFLELSPGSRELIFRLVEDYVQRGGTPFDLTQMPAASAPVPVASAPVLLESPPAAAVNRVGDLDRSLPGTRGPEPGGHDPFAEMAASLPPLDELVPDEGPRGTGPSPRTDALPALEDWDAPAADTPDPYRLEEPAPAPGARATPPPLLWGLPEAPAAPGIPAIPDAAPARKSAPMPRRRPSKWFWGTLLGIALLAAVGYVEWERISAWIGIDDPEAESAMIPPQPARPTPRATPPAAPVPAPAAGLTTEAAVTDAAAAAVAASPAPAAPTTPAPAAPSPLPEKVEPAATGPAVTVLEKITWEQKPEGTDIVLWGDGVFRRDAYSQVRVGGSPPREVLRINGAARPFRFPRLAVDTAEVKQIRIGFHERPAGNEIHVVFDLTDAAVSVVGVEEHGNQLRLLLRRR